MNIPRGSSCSTCPAGGSARPQLRPRTNAPHPVRQRAAAALPSAPPCQQPQPPAGSGSEPSAAAAAAAGAPLALQAPRGIRRRAALLSGVAAAAAALAAGPGARWRPARAYLLDEAAAQSVFALASRSVVSINDYRRQAGGEAFEGVGTGFVWDQYGHVVTNYHVVSKYVLDKSGQQEVKVVLDDGSGSSGGGSSGSGAQTFQARVIGTDAQHDLAVLQIDAPRSLLVPIRVGASDGLRVGQSVYAIGNPAGLAKTLTAGVVSGLNRTIPAPTGTRIYGAIQTDASINAGNSGGPLLDSFGRLVGVSTASFTRSGSGRSSGVNFALPADLVRSVVPNLIVFGTAAGKGVRRG